MFNLDITNENLKGSVTETEYEVLQAIWRLYILQFTSENISFVVDSNKADSTLGTELAYGNPVLLIINNNHAIIATKLFVDVNDNNKYKIEVYDNNFAGEKRYINMSRTKSKFDITSASTWFAIYQYTFTYDSNNDGVEEDTTVNLSIPTIE